MQRTLFLLITTATLWLAGCQQQPETAMVAVDLSKLPPPPIDPKEPPLPKINTVKFLSPEVKLDEEVPEQMPPPAVKEPKEAVATNETQEGDPNAEEVVAAPEGAPALPDRQFIRAAQLKFSVPRVASAVERIEQLTTQQGGFVTQTRLNSEINDTQTIAISADSLLETTRYTVSNTMTLRVPNARLDTTLRALAQLADFIDYRAISADDVTLQRMAAAQLRRRNAAHDRRLQRAIDRQGRKLGETTNAEENRVQHQQEGDEAQVNDLNTLDQIQFSSIALTVYQRPAVRRVVLPANTNIHQYEPGFLTKVADALTSGANLLKSFVLTLLEGWGLIVFGLLGYVLIRYAVGWFKRPTRLMEPHRRTG